MDRFIKVFILHALLGLTFMLISGLHALNAWHDETHLAIAKAAGYEKWYNATGADIAKIKAKNIERYNHWYDNPGNLQITRKLVMDQVPRYNDIGDRDGHLYGAIIASFREYKKSRESRKYADYHLAFMFHYIGDLSQPFHNMAFDDFNKSRHGINDAIVEHEVLANLSKIQSYMSLKKIRRDYFESDLVENIVSMARQARALGQKLKKEKRNMKPEEAYYQLGQSASLIRSILDYLEKE